MVTPRAEPLHGLFVTKRRKDGCGCKKVRGDYGTDIDSSIEELVTPRGIQKPHTLAVPSKDDHP